MAIQGPVRKVFFPPKFSSLSLSLAYYEKVPEKLMGLTQYKKIEKKLKNILYKAVDTQEVEGIWLKMIKDDNIKKK